MESYPPRQSRPLLSLNQSSSRRYACDRCRGHKLRCMRDPESGNAPCLRCHKAAVSCNTTSKAPIGLPAKSISARNIRQEKYATPVVTEEAAAVIQDVDPASWTDGMDFVFEEDNVQFGGLNPPICDGSQNMLEIGESISSVICSPPQYFHDAGMISDPLNGMNHGTNHGTAGVISTQSDATNLCESESIGDYFSSVQNYSSFNLESSLTSPDQISNSKQVKFKGLKPAESQSNMPKDDRESYIMELVGLTSSLMKDLNSALMCKENLEYIITSPPLEASKYISRKFDEATATGESVSRLLKLGDEFISIAQKFRTSGSITTLQGEYSSKYLQDLGHARENQIRLSESTLPQQPVLMKPPPVDSGHDGLPAGNTSFVLAILTCYSTLIQLCEAIVSMVFLSLGVLPGSALDEQLPPTLSDLQIGGFQLKNRKLQVKILVDVLKYMLASVEKAMGFHSDESGIASEPLFRALLSALIKQRGIEDSEDNKSGMKLVRDWMERIELALD